MEAKNILHDYRVKNGLTQDELAEKVFVTRQAVSRWENGETLPNTETLKLLSKVYRKAQREYPTSQSGGMNRSTFAEGCRIQFLRYTETDP